MYIRIGELYHSDICFWEFSLGKKTVGILIWFRVQSTFKFWYFFRKSLWCVLFVNSIWAAYHAPTHHTQHSTLHLWWVSSTPFSTLVCRIDVHTRLLILRKKSTLHGLILVCTFIDFEKKFPPAHLFHPARLLVLVCSQFHSTHDPVRS